MRKILRSKVVARGASAQRGPRLLCSLMAIAVGFRVCLAPGAVAEKPSVGCETPPAAGEAAVRGIERTLVVDGEQRTYILDVPASALRQRPAALLLDFHGFQHSAAGVWRVSEFKQLGEQKGFITAYPQGLPVQLLGREGSGWQIFATEGNRDLRFVRALIDHIGQQYCVDLQRVYATGFSNGGFLTHLIACTMADVLEAIAPVGGGLVPVPCTPARPVRVIIHHGRRDERVPMERARALRDRWRELNGCKAAGETKADGCTWYSGCKPGGAVVFCEADLGHHWPPGASERIWQFFEDSGPRSRAAGATPPACAGCVPTP